LFISSGRVWAQNIKEIVVGETVTLTATKINEAGSDQFCGTIREIIYNRDRDGSESFRVKGLKLGESYLIKFQYLGDQPNKAHTIRGTPYPETPEFVTGSQCRQEVTASLGVGVHPSTPDRITASSIWTEIFKKGFEERDQAGDYFFRMDYGGLALGNPSISGEIHRGVNYADTVNFPEGHRDFSTIWIRIDNFGKKARFAIIPQDEQPTIPVEQWPIRGGGELQFLSDAEIDGGYLILTPSMYFIDTTKTAFGNRKAQISVTKVGEKMKRNVKFYTDNHLCSRNPAILVSAPLFVPSKAKPGQELSPWTTLVDTLTGNPVSNREIVARLSGPGLKLKKVNKTSSDGIIAFLFNLPQNIRAGKYKLTFSFEGDNDYNQAEISQTIEITNERPKAWFLVGDNKTFGYQWNTIDEHFVAKMEKELKKLGYDMSFLYADSEEMVRKIIEDPWTQVIFFIGHMNDSPLIGLYGFDQNASSTEKEKKLLRGQEIASWACEAYGKPGFPHIYYAAFLGCKSMTPNARGVWETVFPRARLIGSTDSISSFTPLTYFDKIKQYIPKPNKDPSEIVFFDAGVLNRPASCPADPQAEKPTNLLPWGISKSTPTVNDYPIEGLPNNDSVNIFAAEKKNPLFHLATLEINDKLVTETPIPSEKPVKMVLLDASALQRIMESNNPFEEWKNAQKRGEIKITDSYMTTKLTVELKDYLRADCLVIKKKQTYNILNIFNIFNKERICWKENQEIKAPELAAKFIAGLVATESKVATAYSVGKTIFFMSKTGKKIEASLNSVK